MDWRALKVSGAWEITPRQFTDPRGVFLEVLKQPEIVARLGRSLEIAQVNCSVSASGVVRGVHFADTPPGQAKYVTCVSGAAFDVVVDIRVGSPTFGAWDAVLLDSRERRASFNSEGLGHAFCSLEEGTSVVYMCSTVYTPEREHGVHPFDPGLGIEWPSSDRGGSPLELQLSDKDAVAPTLAEARSLGLLPDFGAVTDYLGALAAERT